MRRIDARRVRVVTVWTLLGLLAGACRGGPLEPGDALGTVRLTATGAVSVSGPGFATVHLLPLGGTTRMQIVLSPAPATSGITSWQVTVDNDSGRLPVGTYPLLRPSASNPTATVYYTTGGPLTIYHATAGDLVITASSPWAVRGSVHFTATEAGGAGTVSVEAVFNASCTPGMACQ